MSSEPPAAAAAVLMVVEHVVVEVGDGGCVEEGEYDGAVSTLILTRLACIQESRPKSRPGIGQDVFILDGPVTGLKS